MPLNWFGDESWASCAARPCPDVRTSHKVHLRGLQAARECKRLLFVACWIFRANNPSKYSWPSNLDTIESREKRLRIRFHKYDDFSRIPKMKFLKRANLKKRCSCSVNKWNEQEREMSNWNESRQPHMQSHMLLFLHFSHFTSIRH